MNKIDLKSLVKKTKKLKILYVEDNQETRAQAIKIFNNFVEYIDVAVDGLDGLTQYKVKEQDYYDLIISDINMPNMNGIDMAEAILNINSTQDILIITAYNNPEYLQELINIGVTNYIHKPIRMDSLITEFSKVVEALEKKEARNKEFEDIKLLNHELDALVDTFDTYVIASRTDLKGKITYASKAYEEISGYKESELLGKPHNIVRHPDMPKSAFKNLWDTIQAGRLWVGDVKNLRKDGTFYWVKASIAPYYDTSGKHIGYSAIRLDITAQKEVEELNNEVTNLLNNAGQGFLSFGANMSINESFSKECLNIFNTVDISKQNISQILFSNDEAKKELFTDGISRILDAQEDMIKEVFLSLLPKEHTVNDKDIKIEYKLLPENKFMIVLTNITKTKKLENKIQEQNQTQKMIVAVASNKDDFIDIKLDFENFMQNPSEDLKVLLRELHTFKGIFAQKEMVNITFSIHELETKINKMVQKDDMDISDIIKVFNNHNLGNIFNVDLEIISSILGEDFLNVNSKLNIDMNAFTSFEEKLKHLDFNNSNKSLEDILYDFEKFKDETVYSMLNIHPVSVKKMAQKLEKEIYPLEILGDKNFSIATKYKPFMKSLVHLFNNCVEHGIEDMETRAENGKDDIGTISAKFENIDNILKIVITDDGAGIDIDKLSTSAIRNGIKTENELDDMSDEEKLFLVFADNLSTKEEVSTTSGRGVGMSAIKSEIDKLNGSVKIKNNIGCGVEFIFTLPLNA